MSLASNTVFPSGGRLGRRPRAWSRLLVSSAAAVGFAAVLVGLAALGTHRSAGAGSATAATRKSVLTPKKIVEAPPLSGDQAPAAAPSGPAVAKAGASSPVPNPAQAGSPSPPIVAGGDPAAAPSVDFTPIVPSVIPYGSGSTDPQDASGAAPTDLADVGATAASLSAAPTDDQAPPPSRTGPDATATEAAPAAASPHAPPVRQADSAPPAAPRRQIEASPKDDGQPLALVSADEAAEPASAPAPAPSAATGEYAAYLSTSATEAEARGLLAPLQRKYAAEFRGQRLSYHRMRVNGAVVYRVRIGRLAEASAQSLCQKLRALAGNCDVGPE